jgi:hypothetical protein
MTGIRLGFGTVIEPLLDELVLLPLFLMPIVPALRMKGTLLLDRRVALCGRTSGR